MEVNIGAAATGHENCENYPIKQESCGIQDNCRICMAVKMEMNDLFASDNANIVEKIEFCTGLQMLPEKGFPTYICYNCLENLDIAHKFKSSCLQADATFRKVVREIKTELNDDSFETDLMEDSIQPDVNEDAVHVSEKKPQRSARLKKIAVKKNERMSWQSDSELVPREVIDLLDDEDSDCYLNEDEGVIENEELDISQMTVFIEYQDGALQRLGPEGDCVEEALDDSEDDEEWTRAHQLVEEAKNPLTKESKTNAKKRGPHKKGPSRLKKLKFRRLYCEACELSFDNKQQSDEHMKAHKKEPWICEICGKTYSVRSSHYAHVRSHTAPTHRCDHCDYSAVYKGDLIKHLRRHSGKKRYQCHFCPAEYYDSSNLYSHVRRVHDGLKRYQCELCEQRFYERSKLNRHMDTHSDVKRFECELCLSRFSRRCQWRHHLERRHAVIVPRQRPGPKKTGCQ